MNSNFFIAQLLDDDEIKEEYYILLKSYMFYILILFGFLVGFFLSFFEFYDWDYYYS